MSSSIRNLIDELGRLSSTLASLTSLTYEEAKLLARAEVNELREILQRKSELLKLAGIHRESCRLFAAKALGVTLTEHARLATLIEEIGLSLHHAEDTEQHEQLTHQWQAIICTLDELRQAQERSERFARQGMSWIEGCLEHLTQPTSSHTNSIYTRQGKAKARTSSFLARKA